MNQQLLIVLFLSFLGIACPASAEDWPAFRGGPFRGGCLDGASISSRPALQWRSFNEDHVSPAYASSPAIVGSRIFVGLAEQSVFSATGRLVCFELATGKEVWEAKTR